MESKAGDESGDVWLVSMANLASSRCAAGEPIGDAEQQSTRAARIICEAAIAAGAALGCATVTLSCASGTTLTWGALAVPCELVIVAACLSFAEGAAVYRRYGCIR